MKTIETELDALNRAIIIVGNQTKLASLIEKTPGHTTVWVNRDKRVPADMAKPIEEVTGVSRHLLRPDIFGEQPDFEKPVAA
jgi:DNA-binding transcriptional regulator YdaS (Cro superfamily)